MLTGSGIQMLELSGRLLGAEQVIHPAVVWDENGAVLVDAGYPGQLPLLKEQLERYGLSADRLTAVILTHHDIDHLGGLPELLQQSPQPVKVLAHEGERPYVQGEKTWIKFTPETLKQIDSWPKELAEPMKRLLANPPKAQVDAIVADGEDLPYGEGLVAIHTPGHTPGHLCLYHKQSKTLVAGDALTVIDGVLQGPNPQATFDLPLATASLKKLAEYDIDSVICYHGGRYRGDANAAIARLSEGK